MRVCKQCGLEKDDKNFRQLYGKNGSYRICLECESINSRLKYLLHKEQVGTITDDEIKEIETIEDLYERQRAMGLKPPRRRGTASSTVDRLVGIYNAEAQKWLTAELTEKPEYYIDEVFVVLRQYLSYFRRITERMIYIYTHYIFYPLRIQIC